MLFFFDIFFLKNKIEKKNETHTHTHTHTHTKPFSSSVSRQFSFHHKNSRKSVGLDLLHKVHNLFNIFSHAGECVGHLNLWQGGGNRN